MNILFALFITVIIWHNTLCAKTHEVLVSSNVFTPSTLVIEAGDTVRWRNTGGSHNVFAINGNFRCAQGCEANGGDGNPSSEPWVAEVTFRQLGTFVYICQPHIGFGMQGSVTVIEPNTVSVVEITATIDHEFIPDEVELLRGDAIRFINQGGEHNINAIDDSFICSEGCMGDGTNTEYEPTGFPWDIFIKFNEIVEIPYFCSQHNNTGLLRVLTDTFFENGFD